MTIIVGLILIYIILNIVHLSNLSVKRMENSFNPIRVYKDNNVNWLGCIILVLLAHLLFLPISIVYWFYKLCTVGRKKEEK
jgi:hypothetical protein